MEQELFWDNEVVADHDELIAKLEAEIIESKAFLSRLSNDDDKDDLLF